MRALQLLMVGVVTAGLLGCSTGQVKPEEYSGFLGDYSRLKAEQSPSGAPVLRWVDPALDINRYRQFYIEPSQFHPRPEPSEKVSGETLVDITRYYDAALRRELGKELPVADRPGPDTIIIRPAITAVSSHIQGLRPYEVIPIALVAAAVSTASGIRDEDTEIATEAAFIDSDRQIELAQVVRKGSGETLENRAQQLTIDDVKAVLDGWAVDLRQSYRSLKTSRKIGLQQQ
ncbi:DUF3313 domain-containing protein [Zestomonas carbonaria]|uniref:DUF3313 domain-containing protein n=1 Tax=Zestomonas carbonaria TaxID=2762745 RepID=A0A7U7EQF0_9GAMM|nr:DUF3313 domain-containing protein [Pseudomonas carbonaria]CAD5109268.1 hypothetical protein PSEWESI4_03564 [Pseudomonas carbonaria]